MIIAFIELFLAVSVIAINPIVKLGWRLREGSLIVGKAVYTKLGKAKGKGWQHLTSKSLVREKRINQLMQCFIYIFALLSFSIAVFYLTKKEWLINPYIIIAAFMWMGILGAIPLLKKKE